MTKHFKFLALAALITLVLVPLAFWVQAPTQPNDREQSGLTGGDTAKHDGIGGDFRECLIHSGHFHRGLDPFIGTLVSPEDVAKWVLPLQAKWTSPQGECLINLSTFIEHFGITREQIQRVIDDTQIDFFLEYNLDILFSGDKALIEAYYAIENEELHTQKASARRDKYLSGRLINLQRVVIKNATMSRYYHDIWTFASSMPTQFKAQILVWMQGLVDAGQYDRVNIVELVQHERVPRETFFERFATEHNMNLFTHYNPDVIFSGDPQLIKRYYSKENESSHTGQVRERFEQFASKHGQPAKNPRLD